MKTECGCPDKKGLTFSVAPASPNMLKTPQPAKQPRIEAPWITGYKQTAAGDIPVVSTRLSKKDIIDGWKVRWGIGRMTYRITPGLYCIGKPDEASPVFVSANYKLTFDKLRKELSGTNGWLLILDTKGVNVWCAAGKGTFGTAELVKKIFSSNLSSIISHRRLILPQLGAVGVSAPDVRKLTGFSVIFGPVLARDLKEFLDNGCRKTEKMRTVYFNFADRMAIAPMELVHSAKYAAVIAIAVMIVSTIEKGSFTAGTFTAVLPFLAAILTGTLLFPALLPYLPFRSFAAKGYVLGLLATAAMILAANASLSGAAVYLLLLPPIVSFLALNFTGASTYTSLTGTQIEVKISVPLIALSALAGILLKIGFVVKDVIVRGGII